MLQQGMSATQRSQTVNYAGFQTSLTLQIVICSPLYTLQIEHIGCKFGVHTTTAGILLTHSCQYVNKASAQCHETGSKTQDHYSNGIAVASLPQHIASSF